MANSLRRSTGHRTPDIEVHDRLPPRVRAWMMEGPQEWSAQSVLTRYQQLLKAGTPPLKAEETVIGLLHSWNASEIDEGKPWHPKLKPFQRRPKTPPLSPHLAAGATMQLSGHPLTSS